LVLAGARAGAVATTTTTTTTGSLRREPGTSPITTTATTAAVARILLWMTLIAATMTMTTMTTTTVKAFGPVASSSTARNFLVVRRSFRRSAGAATASRGAQGDNRTPTGRERIPSSSSSSVSFASGAFAARIVGSTSSKRGRTDVASSNGGLVALFSSSSGDDEEAVPAARRTLEKNLPSSSSDEGGGGTFEVFDDDSDFCVYASEQTIKKSRFIGLARHAESWKDASDFVEHVRGTVHPKARHWCFAYRGTVAGGGSTITERASDDGEPTGTAGQPILNALTTETDAPGGIVDVVVAVVRYSGGIKLGAGGLVRAYGGTARMVLRDHARFQATVVPKRTLEVTAVQPRYVGSVYDLAAKHGATVTPTGDDGTGYSVTCEDRTVRDFTEKLMDATRGSVVVR